MLLYSARAPAVVAVPKATRAEGKKRAAPEIITIDSDDEETPEQELIRLRKENAALKESPEQELIRLREENAALKRIKLEPRVKLEVKSEHDRKPKVESRKDEKPRIVLIDD